MKVEVWSDIACPFCYIGKRRFEAGLEQFANKDQVVVTYRSFQLDPNAPKNPSQDIYGLIAAKYGISREETKKMHDDLVRQAAALGLTYRFDHAIPANSLDAHRLIHLAGQYGKRSEMAELLFKAYFTDSKHIGDHETLAGLAAEAGLVREEAAEMLKGTQFAEEVRAEGREASSMGASGVPFYVINRKYGVSGAQAREGIN
jgi:predicted DsbA family dithiol-disulfide isomerase